MHKNTNARLEWITGRLDNCTYLGHFYSIFQYCSNFFILCILLVRKILDMQKRSDQTLIGTPLTGSRDKAKGRTSHLRECLANENAEEFHNKGEGHMKSKLEYIWLDGYSPTQKRLRSKPKSEITSAEH